MPYGNRKGPAGHGPKTGRGIGICAGNEKPGYLHNNTKRFGSGRNRRERRRNLRRRNGRGFALEPLNVNLNEKGYLTRRLEILEQERSSIETRLEEISNTED